MNSGNELGRIIAEFCKKHSTKILTGVGVAGTAVTGYLAWTLRPKYDKAVEKKEKEKGAKLTTKEKVITAIPYALPPIATGIAGSASVISAEICNTNIQRSLTESATAVATAYSMYRSASKEIYGADAEENIMEKVYSCPDDWVITEPNCFSPKELIGSLDTEERLFFDDYSRRYFRSSLGKVQDAMSALQHDILLGGAPLAKWYELNGIYDQLPMEDRVAMDNLGWAQDILYYTNEIPEIGFDCTRRKRPDGTDVIVIKFDNLPVKDYVQDMDYDLAYAAPAHLDEN